MVIKSLELCVEMVKITTKFAVVAADAVTNFLRTSHPPPSPPPPPHLRHGLYSYSATSLHPSPYIIGFHL
ncbi:unnamed protein product [Cochlearia groenlandica]